ncbi:MAG TPA: tonB-system energizer ExbB [Xanthobacteraceae bacterium]|jgi:biopolymer transport protein ExbB|nr:tonB-system energizer ExbB [Xanthobacteraceae bacterium]
MTGRVRFPTISPRLWAGAGGALITLVVLATLSLAPAAFAQGNSATPAPPPDAAAAPSAPASASPATAPASPMTQAAPTAPSTPSSATPAMSPPSAASPAPAPSGAMAPAAAPTAEPAAPPAAAAEPAAGQHMVSAADLPEDLSPWGMFENADIIVKAVIIGLAFASLVTWTVWLAKTLELNSARRAVRRDIRALSGATTFAQAHEQLHDGNSPVSQMMQASAQEIRLSATLRAEGLKERIALQLERIEMAVSRKISRGTGVLATIGSTAPFVGLFGTVWGIMNSFIGISNAHTTNLAVVAPGIAQALLATAFGLVAAIPAVMIYNVLARQTAHYRAYLGDASAQLMRLVSRDLDRAKTPIQAAQAAE